MPPQTVREALEYCAVVLQRSDAHYGHGTDNAWDDAVQLVLHATDIAVDAPASSLDVALDPAAWSQLQVLVEKRTTEFVPVPYLTGKAWFAGLEFICDSRALVPRSPIAELILDGFAPWYTGPGPARVLDLCCGGGSIGLSIAHYFQQARVDLLDIDADALALARQNAAHLSVAQRVSIQQSDLFDALGDAVAGERYDIIVSNPPYVDADDLATMPLEYHHEPAIGLGSGPDGLELTRRILSQASTFLAPEGILIVEVGNSWEALEAAFPTVPFTWLEFEHGGHGVFTLSARELQDYSASFSR